MRYCKACQIIQQNFVKQRKKLILKFYIVGRKFCQMLWICTHEHSTVADLGGRTRRPPPRTKFYFYRVFRKILLKYWVSAPPPRDWRPLLGEVLDPPLFYIYICTLNVQVKLQSFYMITLLDIFI